MASELPAVVVGGGFFGCELAVRLADRFDRVILLEAADDLLTRASFHNQARVHNGYHYPRSMLTALRSRLNYPRFKADYATCIDDQFTKYYAVPRKFSKVGATQFEGFCRRLGAACRPVRDAAGDLFDRDTVEGAYVVDECAFDAAKLRDHVRDRLRRANVEVRLNTRVEGLRPLDRRAIEVIAGSSSLAAAAVFSCVYSGTNDLMRASGLPPIPLKHELTEIALVEAPPELRRCGITIMCGPFFSCMPFPARGLHSLSHVRFTPHCSWSEGGPPDHRPATNVDYMIRDASRFVPAMKRARYVESMWEIKTVLPRSEGDDGRPILFLPHHGMPNLHCILGSKIDNIYDALDHVESTLNMRRTG